jgi:hypothetical protein
MTACSQTTITIPTSYADVTTFRFDRVVKDTLDNESIYDMVGDLFNPLAYGQSVAVVVRVRNLVAVYPSRLASLCHHALCGRVCGT